MVGALLALGVLALLAAPAHAQDTVSTLVNVGSDWALKPSDIAVGGQYRLMFLTRGEVSLNSADISVYDAFVQERARATGHQAIRSYASVFRVVGSTDTVDARDHTGTNPAISAGVPIYWLNGRRNADDYNDFYDGSWDTSQWRYENGNRHANETVATGTYQNGKAHATGPLGSGGSVCAVAASDSVTLCSRFVLASASRSVFGLSQVFRVVAEGLPYITHDGIAVTSTPAAADGYETDDVIEITVTFSAAVAVNGTPTLALTIGAGTGPASCAADPDDAKNLICSYTVTAADQDNDGLSIAANALALNGGAIHKPGDASTAAFLGHSALPADPDHPVNSVPFIVSSGVSVTSTAPALGSYGIDDVIQVTVTFSEPVTVNTTTGTPRLALSIGENTRLARYSPADSTATELAFAYPVVGGDHDQDGISIAANALDLNGGAIHRPADTSRGASLDHAAVSAGSAHRVNRAPFIVADGVAVTSIPRTDTGTYGVGETIEISVEFSEAVNATSNTDFVLSVSGAKRAALLSGSGTETLVFGYEVQADDEDSDGIWIGDQDRTLVGSRSGNPQNGAITLAATSVAADLTHGHLGTQRDHKVDGSRTPPVVYIVAGGVAVTSTPRARTDTYGFGETIEISVQFSEAVRATTPTDFVLAAGGGKRAPLLRGSGTATLVFGYTVRANDEDSDGIWIGDQDRTLVGDRNGNPQNGAILHPLFGWPAGLTHGELGTLSDHKVDGSLGRRRSPSPWPTTGRRSPRSSTTYSSR